MKEGSKKNGRYVSIYLGHVRTMRDKDFKEIRNKKDDLKLQENKRFEISRDWDHPKHVVTTLTV